MIARILTIACAVLALAPSAPAQEAPAKEAQEQPAKQDPAKQPAAKEVPAKQAPAPDARAPASQDARASAAQAGTYSREQLEQIVAPIALYPDALLAQIMMAATYPLEIVEAARWVQKNPKVTGDKLEAALQRESWDPSVKSLCGFADVLKRMNDNLDWTQDLGDAFLGQQAEVMDAVQNMRRKAYDAGNLESSRELRVTEQADKIIVIEAAQPEVIYVPTYYPTAVYGGWSYPYWYYPPMYPPPPAGAAFFGFTVGVIWGSAMWGGCNWGWGHTEVDIDIDRQNNFIDRTEVDARRDQVKDRAGTTDRSRGRGNWQHDPSHRKGVGYKDTGVAQRYGGGAGSTRVSKDQARGYGQRPSAATGAGARDAGRSQPAARTQPSRGTTPSSTAAPRTSGQKSGSFSGARSPSLDRASSSRGASSRGSRGARGGGGRGRGR